MYVCLKSRISSAMSLTKDSPQEIQSNPAAGSGDTESEEGHLSDRAQQLVDALNAKRERDSKLLAELRAALHVQVVDQWVKGCKVVKNGHILSEKYSNSFFSKLCWKFVT